MAAMMALTIVGCGGNNTVALQNDKAAETTKQIQMQLILF